MSSKIQEIFYLKDFINNYRPEDMPEEARHYINTKGLSELLDSLKQTPEYQEYMQALPKLSDMRGILANE